MYIGVIGIPDGWSTKVLVSALESRNIRSTLIDMNETVWDISNDRFCFNKINIMGLDAVIIKKLGSEYNPHFLDKLSILEYFSSLGLRFFSRPENIKTAVNRLTCTSRLKRDSIPIPPTTITENLDEAEKAVQRYHKAVIKPLFTSKAKGMMLVEYDSLTRDKLASFKKKDNPVLYIQKMVEIPGRDLGIVFMGGKYLATYSRVMQTDSWNTTIRTGGKYEPFQPSKHIIDIAERAQQIFGLDFTCVDIAETPDGPVVFEVSPFGGFRGLKEANNIDAASLYADFIIARLG